MLKKYISNSDISINVRTETGEYTHISFSPLTGGGSSFYTDDEQLQKALEAHSKFNRLFTEEPVPEVATAENEDSIKDETDNKDGIVKIKVDSLDSAKEYLCEHYGMTRTSLKTKKSIFEAAASNGIEFEVGIV